MNKKVIVAIVVVAVVVLAVVLGMVFLKRDKQDENSELNLQELNTTISAMAPFDEMPTMEIDQETLEAVCGISSDIYEEAIGKMPMMNVQASMYLIIKAKDGKVEDVKSKVEDYATKQENIWSTYLPDQYDLVKARKLNVVGNYVYLIISESADEIEKLISK